ncbi:hypothetical protein ACHAW5_005092 [Stephanodiscus triporus]|uniref:Uncharacterized protein n=1 Tax=Stephanodiscus triporus TaxID=2934178 RepID=A0ABD3MGF4_9STRA
MIEDSTKRIATTVGEWCPSKEADVVCIRYDDLVAAFRGGGGGGDRPSDEEEEVEEDGCAAAAAASAASSNIAGLIEGAFSSIGLGIIAITDVPNLHRSRLRLLRLSQKLATLPADQLEGITVPESSYQVGWSHGREKLEGDKLDYSKGSFYANPLTEDLVETMLERRRYRRSRIPMSERGYDVDDDDDDDIIADRDEEELLDWDESLDVVGTDDELRALARSNPAFFAPNVWPAEGLPDMESAFREVGRLMHEVGIMVARCCDSYASSRVSTTRLPRRRALLLRARGENTAPRPLTLLLVFFLTPTPKQKCPGYEPKLEKILRHSKCCKGRLLHYFPAEEDDRHSAAATDDDDDRANNNNGARDDAQFSDWCGWHNDHGSLTGLLPALYLDGDGNIVDSPDVEAGLYIKARDGTLVHAKIPENAVAYQVGETAQIHTGGLLKATPRAVRGCKGSGRVSRETFAVFMEPEFHSAMDLPIGRTLEDAQCIEDERWLPSSVRTLRSRWKLGMTFGDFSNATFSAFH